MQQIAESSIQYVNAVSRRLEEQGPIRTELGAIDICRGQNFAVIERIIGFGIEVRIIEIAARFKSDLVGRKC